MKRIVILLLKIILCLSATFSVCGAASIIEFGTGAIETVICIALCIVSFNILDRMGVFRIYE